MLEILSLADEVLIVDTKNPFVLIGSIWRSILYCHRQKIDIVMGIEFYSKFSTIMVDHQESKSDANQSENAAVDGLRKVAV